jgi:hypothetical protein
MIRVIFRVQYVALHCDFARSWRYPGSASCVRERYDRVACCRKYQCARDRVSPDMSSLTRYLETASCPVVQRRARACEPVQVRAVRVRDLTEWPGAGVQAQGSRARAGYRQIWRYDSHPAHE